MMRLCAGYVGVLALLWAPVAHGYGGKLIAEFSCPVAEPMGLAVRGDFLWISDLSTRTISKVNKADGGVVETLDAPGMMPTGLAWHGEILFAADRRQDSIARRRPGADADLSPIEYFERWAMGMTHDGEHLWVVDARSRKIHKIDPVDGTTIQSFDTPANRPTGIAFDGRYLWVADHKEDTLYMLDRRDGAVLILLPSPGPYPSALAADGDTLWVADYQTQRLYRIALPDETPYVEDDPRKVHASYKVYYRAQGTGEITNLTAHVAVPQEIPGQHILGELTFEPTPTRFETDRWGQKVAIFELGKLAAGELRTVSWEGDFTLFRTRFHMVPERIQSSKLPGGLDAYLKDDKKYDLSSQTIRKLVEDLTRTETSYYWRARALYEHLTEVIKYDRSGGWNNAATVLERGTGSCSEYTFALVALLRRAGIPARYVGAMSERGDAASFDDVFHRWAEAYMPGYGWVSIDANAGYGEPPGEKGFFFGGRSNRHLITTIGGGASEYLDWTYNSHETFQSRGAVKLEIRPISRYRPIEEATEPAPHEAPKVRAPRLTAAIERGRSPDAGGKEPASPWTAGIALLVAVVVGLLLGLRLRAR